MSTLDRLAFWYIYIYIIIIIIKYNYKYNIFWLIAQGVTLADTHTTYTNIINARTSWSPAITHARPRFQYKQLTGWGGNMNRKQNEPPNQRISTCFLPGELQSLLDPRRSPDSKKPVTTVNRYAHCHLDRVLEYSDDYLWLPAHLSWSSAPCILHRMVYLDHIAHCFEVGFEKQSHKMQKAHKSTPVCAGVCLSWDCY